MSNQFSKASIAVADLPKKERNLPSVTQFSNNFFNLTPVYHKPVYVGDTISVSGQKVSRTLPMPYPAFSCVNDVYRAFYVPYKSIFKGAVDFYETSNHFYADGSQGIIERCPYCQWSDFMAAFTTQDLSTPVTSGVVDFVFNSQSYRFTQRGAQVYKVICGLGYDLVGGPAKDLKEESVSLLALMSYLRVFFDWYWPKNYVPSGNLYGAVRGFFNRDLSVTGYKFTSQEVTYMLMCCGYSFYDDKVFVDCWDTPSGPNDPTLNGPANINISDIDPNINDKVDYGTNIADSPYLELGTEGRFTKFSLNALSSLSDFLKRNQLAGANAIDRFLSRHGKKLVYSDDRAIFLGEHFVPVKVSDVAATSEGSTFNLGDLAGKGWSDGIMSFDLKDANNRGMFLILCSTLPDGELFQGIDKYNLCTTALEFYQPEFYNNGVGAVSAIEVYNNPASTFGFSSQLGKNAFTKVFGFLPIWYQYNMVRNMVIGDFRTPSRGATMLASSHSFRILDDSYFQSSVDNVVHSLEFQFGFDASQYQRLTYLANSGNDFLQTYVRWNTKYISSIPLPKDTYSFDSDAEHNHGSVTLDVGGVEKS